MTTAPQPDDRDELGAEHRICALCSHEEGEHELREANGDSHVFCRICNDAHPFEPLPE